MALQMRQMQVDDAEQMHKLYQQFCLNFVGCTRRNLKQLRQISRKRDNTRWVTIDEKGRIIGYIYAAYVKGRRTGRIIEIITDPKYDFITIAQPLISKICDVFLEKGAAQVQAGTILNPHYSEIFPRMGFLCINTDGVFMYTIIDVAQFLNEITSIIVHRLRKLNRWDGLLQITCENQHKFFRKKGDVVQPFLSTKYPTDCHVVLTANTLARLLLGAVDVQKALTENLMRVETTLPRKKTDELLDTLFPLKQFLALDYW